VDVSGPLTAQPAASASSSSMSASSSVSVFADDVSSVCLCGCWLQVDQELLFELILAANYMVSHKGKKCSSDNRAEQRLTRWPSPCPLMFTGYQVATGPVVRQGSAHTQHQASLASVPFIQLCMFLVLTFMFALFVCFSVCVSLKVASMISASPQPSSSLTERDFLSLRSCRACFLCVMRVVQRARTPSRSVRPPLWPAAACAAPSAPCLTACSVCMFASPFSRQDVQHHERLHARGGGRRHCREQVVSAHYHGAATGGSWAAGNSANTCAGSVCHALCRAEES